MEAIVSVFGGNPVVISFGQDEKPQLCDLKLRLADLLDIPYDEQRLQTAGGVPLGSDDGQDHVPLFLDGDAQTKSFGLYLRLSGGKGGFGNLSGRRIRTVNDAKKVADYVQKEAEREKLKKDKIKRKIEEKLEYADRPTKKHRFEDSKFFDESEEQVEDIKNAVAEALRESMKNGIDAKGKGKGKGKAIEPEPVKANKNGQPLGFWDDMSDYDSEEDGSEEDEDDGGSDEASEEEHNTKAGSSSVASKGKGKGKGKGKTNKK